MSGTEIVYGAGCYAMSGTEIAYAASRNPSDRATAYRGVCTVCAAAGSSYATHYAMSGTDLSYAATHVLRHVWY
eukprot:766595-Rhodomonas_salina.1